MAGRAGRPGKSDGLPYLVRFLAMHAGFGAALGQVETAVEARGKVGIHRGTLDSVRIDCRLL